MTITVDTLVCEYSRGGSPTSPLGPDLLHLWCLQTPDHRPHVDTDWPTLTTEELARGRRLRSDIDRWRYFHFRTALRRILAAYTRTPPESLCFVYSASGKPRLADATGDCQFNLSHSADRAVIAITAGAEVGVDLEMMRPIHHRDALARRYFMPDDVLWVQSAADEPERQRRFLICWTRLEARIKWQGTKLTSITRLGCPEDLQTMSYALDRDSWCSIVVQGEMALCCWRDNCDGCR